MCDAQGLQVFALDTAQTPVVDLQRSEDVRCGSEVNDPPVTQLGLVPDGLQQPSQALMRFSGLVRPP